MNTHALSAAAREAALRRWDAVAKPLGALGQFEEMLARIAAVQGTADIALFPRCALVFGADHGVTVQGISQSGSEVTALVARAIAEGTSNINLMAAAAQADVFAADMGMHSPVPGTIDRRQGGGTKDFSQGPAMTRAQAESAMQAGIDLVGDMKRRGYRLIATGEMGIGNTTAAAALACALLDLSPKETAGRGAGLSDAGLRRKIDVIGRALEVNRPDPRDPMDVLSKLGGFEIAGMAGAFLGGAVHGVPIIMDGVISAAAALLAVRVCPEARQFMLPSHRSRSPGANALMDALRLRPVIDAGMALGEGTGAVMLFPLLDMAYRVYSGIHTFDSLGMAAYQPQGGTP